MATYKFIPGPGAHSYQAVYPGKIYYGLANQTKAASASAPQALTITGTRTISAAGIPGSYNLTATVPGGTGNVSFLDTTNSNTLGSATLGVPKSPLSFVSSIANSGAEPVSIAAGDFNGDGIPDIVTSNSGDGSTVTVSLGNGDGTFTTKTTVNVGGNPYSVVVGDFNGDGILDIAADSDGNNTVTIALGIGDGTFATLPAVSVGSAPLGMAVVLESGANVIWVANYADKTVSVVGIQTDGRTPYAETLDADIGSAAPQGIAVIDYAESLPKDVALSNPSNNTVTVIEVNYAAQTVTSRTFNVGLVPTGLATGDFNGDGISDLAVANTLDGTVTVLLNNGDGTFTTKATATVGAAPEGIAVGDFNGDGVLDIAVTNAADDTVTVLLGNGDGTFTTQATPTVGAFPNGIAVADFNGDGLTDIVTANTSSNGSVTTAGTASVLLNQTSVAPTATLTGVSVAGTGTHLVDFIYDGDANHSAGPSSNTVSLIGTQVPTTLTVSSSLSTASYGQQVVLTAKLAPYTSGSLSTNAESVIFQSNGANIGTGSLSSGVATLNVTSLPIGTDSITAIYGGDANFVTAIGSGPTVTVIAANQKPTLMWATPAAISYGTALSAAQLNASVTLAGTAIAGSYVYSPAAGTVPPAGTDTLTVTFTPTDTTDYSTQTASVPLVVTKATPTITWPAPSPITYGTALSAAQLNATSATPGSFAYTPAAGTILTVGLQTLQATLTPSDSTDYNNVSATVSITVLAAVPTLTFAPITNVTVNAAPFTVSATSASPGPITYGVSSGPATISGSTVTVTGAGTVVLSATQAAAGSYAAATATATFTVTAAPALDFTMSAGTATQSQAIIAGGAATYTLQIAPTGSTYPDNVTFTASGVPAGASFTFSPAIIPANNGPATVNLTVQTNSAHALNNHGNLGGSQNRFAPVTLGLLLFPFAVIRRVRKRIRKAAVQFCALSLLLGGMMSLTGCGGSVQGPGQSYNITVTATSGTLQHSTTVMLQVK
jgi:hypothetical protein